MIGVYGSSHPHGKIADANVLRKVASPSSGPAKGVESGVKPEIEISLLGRQLADAALRATERENSLSREQLGKKGFDIRQQLQGRFQAFREGDKTVFEKDIPLTGDPQAIAQARQAADFLKGQAGNPFVGMSREQLGLIVYDESGEFTLLSVLRLRMRLITKSLRGVKGYAKKSWMSTIAWRNLVRRAMRN